MIYSSNVATATMLSQYVGIDNYKEFLDRYHLYRKVNTDGIDEVSGYTNYGLSPVDDITATYGQGSSLTMLQLIQAYTAMFGNGEMIKPYFIDKIVDPMTRTVLYQGGRKVVSRPISEESAKYLQSILEKVVSDKEGTCRHYAAKTVKVMGKTGTSEIAVDGEYDTENNIISVMLGFPYEDPEYMVYFAYVSPETVYFNYDQKPIPDLIDTIVSLGGDSQVEGDEVPENSVFFPMPNLRSKDLQEGLAELEDKHLDVVVIGDGERIVDQHPSPFESVHTGRRVFLETNGNHILLPDFTDWTRKDLVEY